MKGRNILQTDKEEIIRSIGDITETTVGQLFEEYIFKEEYQEKKEIGFCYEQVEDKHYEKTLMGYTAAAVNVKVIHFPAALDLLKAYLDIWLRLELSIKRSNIKFSKIIEKARYRGLLSSKGRSRADKFRCIRNNFSHIAVEGNLDCLLQGLSIKKGQADVDISNMFLDRGTEAFINFTLAGLDCKALKVISKEDSRDLGIG